MHQGRTRRLLVGGALAAGLVAATSAPAHAAVTASFSASAGQLTVLGDGLRRGSGVEQPEDISVEPQPGGPPTIIQNPMTLFPQGEPVYSGEGYVNSGFLGELNGEPLPGGPAFELTFDTAGEYPYYCILHASGPEGPGMAGTITVT